MTIFTIGARIVIHCSIVSSHCSFAQVLLVLLVQKEKRESLEDQRDLLENKDHREIKE